MLIYATNQIQRSANRNQFNDMNINPLSKVFKPTSDNKKLVDREPSDYQIIEQVNAGRIDRYEVIMRRYNQRLYRIARSIVIDDSVALDAVQEAHIKAFEKLELFKGNCGFPAWLSMIARNEALMMLRKLKSEKLMPFDVDELEQANGVEMTIRGTQPESPDCLLENQQLRAELNGYIDALPDNFRTVFVMRGVAQLSTRETAQILEINEATVKTRFFRAKMLLQKQFITQYGAGVYEVGGTRCDKIVSYVLKYIRQHRSH